MAELPNDFYALLALVFLWGIRHGFDADHLATIDGLTRIGARAGTARARFGGVFFSLGHGAVVTAVAVVVSVLAAGWAVPAWVEPVGVWISIAFLVALAYLNLRAVMTTPPHALVVPVGLRARLVARLGGGGPLLIAAIGALFALSFDTLSQAALFALTAQSFGGWQHGLALGLAFLAGMLVCDGLNGLWIAGLLQRTDRRAALASRIMGVGIAAVALAVAGSALARYLSPAVDAWADGAALPAGLAVMAAVLVSFSLSLALTMRLAGARGA